MRPQQQVRDIRRGQLPLFKASINVAVLHILPSLSLKLAPKLEPARFVLELLPQDVQDHNAGHMATIIKLFDDVKKKEVGIYNFKET